MARSLLVGGFTAALMGAGMSVPLATAYAESRPMTGISFSLLLFACALIVCGVAAVLGGLRQRRGSSLTSGVRVAVVANSLFLAFCVLESSDGLVRQQGRVFYWTTVLFFPALMILYGLLSARWWAWWSARGLTAVACLLFLVVVGLIPFGDIRGEQGPAPWYGRVYMVCVSLVFAGTAASVYRSLGAAESRRYFSVRQQRTATGLPAPASTDTAGERGELLW
jgi:hypothetical protein